MATDLTTNGKRPRRGQPVWDIARMFPLQGAWSEGDYLAIESASENGMIELVDGCLEVLPMPDPYHQRIVRYVERRLDDSVPEGEGEVLTAPMPVRLWTGQMREPDIGYFKAHRMIDPHSPPRGADLVVEVVSPGEENRERDLKAKPKDYAKAKVGEYWIIDPQEQTITVLVLSGRSYKVHGVFRPGAWATSKMLPGFRLDVAAVFAAGKGKRR